MSIEAACSERALMGFPPSSASIAQVLIGRRRKKKTRNRRDLFCRSGNIIFYQNLEEFFNRSIHHGQKPKKILRLKKGGKSLALSPLSGLNPGLQPECG
jgi:hypothetical protein